MDRAVNIILVFLIALNAGLFLLNYSDSMKFRLDSNSQKAATALLLQNGIELSVPLPKTFRPMRQLHMEPFHLTTEEIYAVFFNGAANVTEAEEFDRTVYQHRDKMLIVQNGIYTFYDNAPDALPGGVHTEAAARRLCDGFIRRLPKSFRQLSFRFDDAYKRDDYFVFEYRSYDRTSKTTVYSNYFTFCVTTEGIDHIIFSAHSSGGYTGEHRSIHSPDEALFELINVLNILYLNPEQISREPLRITRLDLVYSFDPTSVGGTAASAGLLSQKALPFYRVYITERNEPFLINAYTNAVNTVSF